MNKVLKGLVAVVSTAAMAIAGFAGAASATAAEQTYTLTVTNTKTGHTYTAYQVFGGRLENGTLSDIKWGNGVNGTELSKAYYNNESASEIAKTLTDANAADFANKVAGGNGATNYLTTAAGSAEGEDYMRKGIDGLSAGYYLLLDTINDSADKHTAYTKFILRVVGDVAVTPKVNYPSVEKKVQENSKYNKNDGYGDGYNDVADYSIGDKVPFKLIGSVPDMSDYDTYKYIFHDTASNGLTLPTADGVKVYVDSTNGTSRRDVTDLAEIVVAGQNLTVTFTDLKQVTTDPSNHVVVEYSATLNTKAEIGLPGNENSVKLEYSNNPNQSGEGGSNPTGETPEDKVIVFTYQLNGTKVDSADQNKKLKDAKFKLQRQSDNKWAKISDNKVTEWVESEDDASVITSDADGNFSVAGLDDGTYNVKETKAPSGYDLPTTPFVIHVTAATSNGQNWNGIANTALTDHTDGIFNETFVNNAGSNLPSTGGMGTTVLYAAGAAIVLVAAFGIAFAVRRRNAR